MAQLRGEVLLIQPIHRRGNELLEAAGLTVQSASASDMVTVAREIGDAVAAITRNAGLDAAAMAAAPRLRVLGNHGVGVDPIDLEAARRLGIVVVNTPGTNARSVAELAVTLMLAASKSLPAADRATRGGDFGFKYHAELHELSGKTVGIVGFGAIGRATAAMLRGAFGVELLVHTRTPPDPALLAELAAKPCDSLERLFAESDVVSLHLPSSSSTEGLIGAELLARMPPHAVLVNTSRGDVIDEAALVTALTHRRIAAAGLDVYRSESMAPDHPLLQLDNVVLTPHIGGSTEEALERTAVAVAGQVLEVLEGRRPASLVDPQVWQRRRTG